MNEKRYNLIDEPWIKVLDQNANTIEVSLKELFSNAHMYKNLAGETPTQNAAIFRILLAIEITVFYRFDIEGNEDNVLVDEDDENPEERVLSRWQVYWNRGKFNGEVFTKYLEKYRERFYLFHPETPFWQVPDMNNGTEYDIKCLLGNMKESNNKATRHHFSMTDGDYLDKLDYSEISRWLIYLNAYSVNVKTKVGNQNIPTKVGRLGQLGVLIVNQENLFRELMINMCPLKNGESVWREPKPTWEKEICIKPGVKILPPDNLPELYTIQSRRIKLNCNEKGEVNGYISIGGDYYDTENDPSEQMTLVQRIKGKKGENDKIVPKLHKSNIKAWREIPTLLIDDDLIPGLVLWIRVLCKNRIIDTNMLITLKTIGLEYGDPMSYTNGNIVYDSIRMSTDLLTELGNIWIIRIKDQINKCVEVRNISYSNLAREIVNAIYSGDKQKTNIIIEKLENKFYFLLDSEFRLWLESINPKVDDMDEKEMEWEKIAYNLSRQVIEEYVANLNMVKAVEVSGAINESYISLRKIYKRIEERR